MPRFFLWFYKFFVQLFAHLSKFADDIFHFTIGSAGLWLAAQTHRLCEKLVFKPAIERARRLSKNICGVLCISGLNSAGASNLKKCSSKIHRCESHRFEYRGVAKRPPGHPDPGAQPASTISVRRVIPWHSRKLVMYILYRSWWVGFRGRGAGAWSVQHIALFLTCI